MSKRAGDNTLPKSKKQRIGKENEKSNNVLMKKKQKGKKEERKEKKATRAKCAKNGCCQQCNHTKLCPNLEKNCSCESTSIGCNECDCEIYVCPGCYGDLMEQAVEHWYEQHREEETDCCHQEHGEEDGECLIPYDSDEEGFTKEKIKKVNKTVKEYNDQVDNSISESFICVSCRCENDE
jgi:hypothetical protein